VYPSEIEDVLNSHPAVAEAAVVGVPDERLGEEVMAFVKLQADWTLMAAELITYCRERMAAYKYPRLIEFRDELPKNTLGKILKRELLPR
jgi:long-chain acyl-CoA synthetase